MMSPDYCSVPKVPPIIIIKLKLHESSNAIKIEGKAILIYTIRPGKLKILLISGSFKLSVTSGR